MTLKLYLYILLLTAFFANGLIGYEIVPVQSAWITEVLIFVLGFRTLVENRRSGGSLRLFGSKFIIGFLCVSIASAIWNDTPMIDLLLFLRKVFRFYLLFLFILNLEIDESTIKGIKLVIVSLFLLQIPVAVVKLFIYGQGEQAIGTYGARGGGNSTVFPLIAVSILVPLLVLHQRSLSYILALFGFLAFGIVGAKRALVTYVPLMVAFALMLSYKVAGPAVNLREFRRLIPLFIFVSLLTVYIGARTIPWLNPEHSSWGSFSPSHIIEFIEFYETNVDTRGRATSRTTATLAAYESVSDMGMVAVALGLGPGTIMESVFAEQDIRSLLYDYYGIRYGMTGLIFLFMQVGVLGFLCWLSFFCYAFVRLVRVAQAETDSWLKAYYAGMALFTCVVILISCTYNMEPTIGDIVPLVYMLLLALSFRSDPSFALSTAAATETEQPPFTECKKSWRANPDYS